MRVHLLPLSACVLLAAGCTGDSEGVQLAQAGTGTGEPRVYRTADMDGLWQGTTRPTVQWQPAIELSIEFESYGPASGDIVLTHYSFPSIHGPGTVNYLGMLDSYDIKLYPDGRMEMDTYLAFINTWGKLVEEYTYMEMEMMPSRELMIGEQFLEVYFDGVFAGAVRSELDLFHWRLSGQ